MRRNERRERHAVLVGNTDEDLRAKACTHLFGSSGARRAHFPYGDTPSVSRLKDRDIPPCWSTHNVDGRFRFVAVDRSLAARSRAAPHRH